MLILLNDLVLLHEDLLLPLQLLLLDRLLLLLLVSGEVVVNLRVYHLALLEVFGDLETYQRNLPKFYSLFFWKSSQTNARYLIYLMENSLLEE